MDANEQIRLDLATQAEKKNQDREALIKLYKGIQDISTKVPGFHNSDIDKTANTVLQSLKLIESWLVKEAQTHLGNKQ